MSSPNRGTTTNHSGDTEKVAVHVIALELEFLFQFHVELAGYAVLFREDLRLQFVHSIAEICFISRGKYGDFF